jgi:hypothetical protein
MRYRLTRKEWTILCLSLVMIVGGCEVQTRFESRSSKTSDEAIVKEVVLSDGTLCAYINGFHGITCNWGKSVQ